MKIRCAASVVRSFWLALVLSCIALSTSDAHQCSTKQRPRVLVLGGGLAGLAAARHLLQQNNVHVTLLEAKNRLGGRLHTVMSASSIPIDLGGMYWHGSSTVLENLKQELSFSTVPTGGDSIHPSKAGAIWLHEAKPNEWKLMTEAEIQASVEMFRLWNAIMLRHFRRTIGENYATSGNETNSSSSLLLSKPQEWWETMHQAYLDQHKAATPLHEQQRQEDWLRFQMRMFFNLDRGVPYEQHSITGIPDNWDWVNYRGEDHILKDGMSSLIQLLQHEIRNAGGDIQLGARVKRIEWDSQIRGCRVTVHSTQSSSLDSSVPQAWTADMCVVTIPQGVLKQNANILFAPNLAEDKLLALDRSGMGTLNTVAVQWDRPVCHAHPNATAYYMVPLSDKDVQRVSSINPLRYGFICSRDPSITQFYLTETALPYENLTFWKEHAVDTVRRIVPSIAIHNILSVQASHWHMDPDFLGSYSAPTTWTRGNDDRRTLARPTANNVLFFAGEHTHLGGRYQSMDGAYETGVRAAQEIQEILLVSPASSQSCGEANDAADLEGDEVHAEL